VEFTGSKTNFILPESVNGLAHACGFLRCGQTVAKCRNRLSWFLVWKLPQRTDILYFLKTASRSAFQKKRPAPYLYSTRGFVQMLVNAIPQLAIPADTYYHYHVNHTPSVLHPGSGYSNEAWHTAIWTPLCCYMKFSPGGGGRHYSLHQRHHKTISQHFPDKFESTSITHSFQYSCSTTCSRRHAISGTLFSVQMPFLSSNW